MSIFLLDTDTLSNTGKSIFDSSQELLDLSETVGSYAVENDVFDFASAKNKIAENLNKMEVRVSNIAQVISYAADTHTDVQNGMKCQASEGLNAQSSSSGTTHTSSGETASSGSSTPQPTNSTSSAGTSGPIITPGTSGGTTPSVSLPSTNNNQQPEQPKFVNYYQEDYSELVTNSASVITAGGASTAMAMILSAINEKEITPIETTKWGEENKVEFTDEQGEITYFENIAKAYGIESETIELTKENILKNISEGKYMIISMDEGKFGSKGNYVVITGITEDGKIKIADPNSVENSEQTWDLSVFLEEGLKLWGFSKPVEKNS